MGSLHARMRTTWPGMTPIPTVLVLDGEQRAALAVVRSLGGHGCTVHVGSSSRHSISAASRYVTSSTVLPNPLEGSASYCSAVAAVVERHHASFLLPVSEASTLAILEHLSRFPNTSLPINSLRVFQQACDKAHVLEIAKGLGIDVPMQWIVNGAPGSSEDVPRDRYPVVVKPVRSVAGPTGARKKVGIRHANTPEQLEQALSDLGRDAGPFLIQERIIGPGLGVFLLRWQGRTIATFAHRRLREKPPSGGVSVRSESTTLAPDLLARSTALMSALEWEGVAMVEYKHDTKADRDYLMEVNPRFWGSLQLAIDSGVDFPWYLLQLAMGLEVPPVNHWVVGVRSRWYLGEIDHLLARVRHSPKALDLPPDAPSLARTAASILLPIQAGTRCDTFRFGDPLPALREAINWVRDL